MSAADSNVARDAAQDFCATYQKIREEISKVIVGQEAVIDSVLSAMLAAGHVLLEGVPGLGKTMLVRTIGEAIDLEFSRIQFTPDMMPADVQGTTILAENDSGGHELQFRNGPLVAQLVLADEINRATPKTQSALLEAMQEKQISVGNRVIALEEPFCVMATQNPVEQEGTYPLPEAQLDRFLFKVIVQYPRVAEYKEILQRTTGKDQAKIERVASAKQILEMREVVRQVPVAEHVQMYAIQIVVGTQPGSDYACSAVNEYVSFGSSPRGAQGLILAAKVRALLAGRFAVSTADIRASVHDVLRHRVVINFHGASDGKDPDSILNAVLDHVQAPHSPENA